MIARDATISSAFTTFERVLAEIVNQTIGDKVKHRRKPIMANSYHNGGRCGPAITQLSKNPSRGE